MTSARAYGRPVDKPAGSPHIRRVDAPTDFEWDSAKAAKNVVKHQGVSFEGAVAVFLDPARADFDVSRPEDGEVRRKVVGMIGDRLYAVTYTMRGEAARLISARRANVKEEKSYGDS